MENIKDYTQNLQGWNFTGERPVILDFYATWCGPCKAMSSVVHDIALDYMDRVDVLKIDINRNEAFAETCGIQSVPTLFFIRRDGSIVRTVGAMGYGQMKQIVEQELLSDH